MSNQNNEIWLEHMYENFLGAIDAGNYELAEAYIQDTHNEGFADQASLMREELRNTPLMYFQVIPSPLKV